MAKKLGRGNIEALRARLESLETDASADKTVYPAESTPGSLAEACRDMCDACLDGAMTVDEFLDGRRDTLSDRSLDMLGKYGDAFLRAMKHGSPPVEEEPAHVSIGSYAKGSELPPVERSADPSWDDALDDAECDTDDSEDIEDGAPESGSNDASFTAPSEGTDSSAQYTGGHVCITRPSKTLDQQPHKKTYPIRAANGPDYDNNEDMVELRRMTLMTRLSQGI